MLTPEQGSHEAERALAAHCGAQVNLRAEVLSFTRLCSRVFTELGGAAEVVPDKGTKLLLMSRAVAAELDGAYIETGDLRSNDQKTGDGDTIHFCREDLQELGRRYFASYRNQTK